MNADMVTGISLTIGAVLLVSYFFLIERFRYFLIVSLWSTFWVFVVFSFMEILFEDGTRYGPISFTMDLMLFFGMGLLGAAWFTYKRPIGHKFAMAGWQMFGLYWLFTIPLHFYNGDLINLMFLGGGLAFFTILGYHEYLSMKWNEQQKGLKFIAGATFVTGFLYFLLAKDWAIIYAITGDMESIRSYSLGYALIHMVAQHSSDFANLIFGYNTYLGPGEILPLEGIGIPIENTAGVEIGGISLILACTGIEAIAMFLGSILTVDYEKDPWAHFKVVTPRMRWYRKLGIKKRALLAFMVTIPPIYILNLVRNAYIIYFIKLGTFRGAAEAMGMDEFTLLHGVFFKIFAFVILIVLALAIFDIVPELHMSILKLFELPKRDAREEVMEARRKKEKAKLERERKRKQVKGTKGKGNDDTEEGDDGTEDAPEE